MEIIKAKIKPEDYHALRGIKGSLFYLLTDKQHATGSTVKIIPHEDGMYFTPFIALVYLSESGARVAQYLEDAPETSEVFPSLLAKRLKRFKDLIKRSKMDGGIVPSTHEFGGSRLPHRDIEFIFDECSNLDPEWVKACREAFKTPVNTVMLAAFKDYPIDVLTTTEIINVLSLAKARSIIDGDQLKQLTDLFIFKKDDGDGMDEN